MRRNIALPRRWNRRVKSAILHILAISHYVFAALQGWAAQNRCLKVRLQAEVDRLKQELGLLQEELRIKDNRMSRVLPHRRPYYGPLERMSILELRATRGWSAQQTAERFVISPATVASWMARIDEEGPSALLRIPQPVNKFPDLVRYIVQRLRLLCPRLGKVKIAEMLCRAGPPGSHFRAEDPSGETGFPRTHGGSSDRWPRREGSSAEPPLAHRHDGGPDKPGLLDAVDAVRRPPGMAVLLVAGCGHRPLLATGAGMDGVRAEAELPGTTGFSRAQYPKDREGATPPY